MSKRQNIMLIGAWVIVLAVPGFPYALRAALLVLTGLAIVAIGYRMKQPAGADDSDAKKAPFVESDNSTPANTPEPAMTPDVRQQSSENNEGSVG